MTQVLASKIRLSALALASATCLLALIWALAIITVQEINAGIQATYFPEEPTIARPPSWLFLMLVFFAFVFAAWSIAAGLVALRMGKIAYSFDAQGLYLGHQSQPAFFWADVKGATLMRGKRRSAVAIVLTKGANLNTKGLLPFWLAQLLGRPTDRDIALTNMDTRYQLQPFLDLIRHHLDTYGQIKLDKKEA